MTMGMSASEARLQRPACATIDREGKGHRAVEKTPVTLLDALFGRRPRDEIRTSQVML